jgi:hypothetical protein
MDYKKFLLTDKPLKILEIGDYVQKNIGKNKNKYYIINTDSSKSSESDNNINFINKPINIALYKIIILILYIIIQKHL